MRKSVSMGRIIAVIAAVLTVFSCVVTAFADTGPKPAVHVSFENLGGAKCYATLLSKRPGGGPWSVWDGREESAEADPTPEIWMAFAKYEDPDGYYFLKQVWEVGDEKSFTWGYYPPEDFKVLIYFTDTGRFASSGPLTAGWDWAPTITRTSSHGGPSTKTAAPSAGSSPSARSRPSAIMPYCSSSSRPSCGRRPARASSPMCL